MAPIQRARGRDAELKIQGAGGTWTGAGLRWRAASSGKAQPCAGSDHAASMVKRKRHELAAEAARRNREVLARLGAEVRESRLRRRMTQAQLGARDQPGPLDRRRDRAWAGRRSHVGRLAADRAGAGAAPADRAGEGRPGGAGRRRPPGDPGAGHAGGSRRRVPAHLRAAEPTRRPDPFHGRGPARRPRPAADLSWSAGTTSATSARPCAPRTASGSRRRTWPRCSGRRDPCQVGQTQARPAPWPPSGSSAPRAGTATSWRATRSSSPAGSPARAEPGCGHLHHRQSATAGPGSGLVRRTCHPPVRLAAWLR